MDNDRLIVRVANALDMGASNEDIHAFLIAELSECDAYLTFRAGEILHNARVDADPTGIG
jgi:hypothetical protein